MSLPPIFWYYVDASYPYRLAIGLGFFLVLGVDDVVRHPQNPRRAKEYLFLVYSAALAVIYAVLHDQITCTISPEYFIEGKGIHGPRPFRLEVAILVVHASYGVGAIAGAALLIANNPSKTREPLPYRALGRLALLPLGGAAIFALLGAVVGRFDPFGLAQDLRGEIPYAAIKSFVIVQSIHTGSYVGAALGTIAAIVLVFKRRARLAVLASPAPTTSSSAPPTS